MNLSGYALGLSGELRSRYEEKIASLGVDPYMLSKGSEDCRAFPSVSNMDIVQYLVFEKSAYTKQEFKAFKSLEAYKSYRLGYLKKLEAHRINDYCVIRSRVTHSQKVNMANTNTWVLCRPSGEVLSAHCDCVAGLGEVCSHVGTTLFGVEDKVRNYSEGQSVTDSEAYWKLPSGNLGTMASVENIRYSSDWTTEGCSSKQMKDVPEPSEKEQMDFLHNLKDMGEDVSLFNILEDFSKLKTSEALGKILYDDNLAKEPLEQLIKMGKTITLKTQDVQAIERLTLGQWKNPKWYEMREGRITASLFKFACRSNIEKPALSLLKKICYPQSCSFSSRVTKYGRDHENDAYEKYRQFMAQHHEGFQSRPTGLFLNNDYPCFAASPDAMVECECCGQGLLEIKCPFCARDGDLLEEVLALKASFLSFTGEGMVPYSLSKNHAYFYQIQAQMAIAKLPYCDFFVWNRAQFFYERIRFDGEFWEENYIKAKTYHEKIIMPELLAHYFTNKN